MKIVFLQNTVDAQGGIVTVNRALAGAFLAAGAEVHFLSLRHAPVRSQVCYPAAAHTQLINDRAEWDCPRYAEAAALLRAKRPAAALRHICRRLRYDRALRRDYRACRTHLLEIDPDVIINSHYELLDCIPPRLLPRTINHFHTSFSQVLALKSYQKTFRRYQDKIGKFVWLSRASCEAAKRFGLENSCCIYNPIAFSSEKTADLSVHRALFLGRFSPEKQLSTAISLFRQAADRAAAPWDLDIYGVGSLDADSEAQIAADPRVHYLGSTSTPREVFLQHSLFLMTSRFEGMPLVVLEAAECGVPTIAMDFGETAPEVVLNGKTGLLLPAGAQEAYAAELTRLLDRPDLREELGAGAKQYAAGFALPAIAAQWFSLFSELSAKGASL